MNTTPREVSSDDLRRHMRPLLNAVQRDREHLLIGRYGERAAVVVPVKWHEQASAALTAFREADNPAMTADQVRIHVVTLAGLLDGMRKIAFAPEGDFREYWKQLNDAVLELAALLPENVE